MFVVAMKSSVILSVLVCGLLPFFASAEERIDGAIIFKGKVSENRFRGALFDIDAKKEGFLLICRQSENKFLLKTSALVLEDAVISKSGTSVALSLRYSNAFDDRRKSLAIIRNTGHVWVNDYVRQRLPSEFGWIVEFGAISDDGKLILAKCAKFLPREADGSRSVNHRWTLLTINEGSIEPLEFPDLEPALLKWAEYAKEPGQENHIDSDE